MGIIKVVSISLTEDTEILGTAIQDRLDEIVALSESQIHTVVVTLRQKLCITAREEAEIAKIMSNNQKARFLIVLIRGRSYSVLLNFLDTITEIFKEEGKSLTSSIYASFDRKKQKNNVKYKCGYCNIKEHVMPHDIADYLWQKQQIKPKLYRYMVGPKDKEIKENDLWKILFTECNTVTHVNYIQKYLKKDNLYGHLADEISAQGFPIQCSCSRMKMKQCLNLRASHESLGNFSTPANNVEDSSRNSLSHMTDTRPACPKRERNVFRCFTCCARKDTTAPKDDSYSLTGLTTEPDSL